MDYQNKRKFKKKKARQKSRDEKMRIKREEKMIEKRSERETARLIYKYRERLIPLRKVEDETEG
tara:strand:+ start:270 stop:461 length:192 start_codon:yes stop_codon:yes gene_type:complete